MELSFLVFTLCFLYQVLPRKCELLESSKSDERYENLNRERKKTTPADPEYEAEKLAGDPADMFGANQHFSYPTEYREFGRRFVPVYPYTEKKTSIPETEEFMVSDERKENEELVPIKAAPEKVIAIAMKSAIQQVPVSLNNVEEVKKEKEILRTGDYWNSVWVENVDPKNGLRSHKRNRLAKEKVHTSSIPKLGSVRAKIMPGSKLFQLVAALQKFSPRLLYVINNKE